jgi:hypothetical protein
VKRHRSIVDCGLEFEWDIEEFGRFPRARFTVRRTDPLGVVLENKRLRGIVS